MVSLKQRGNGWYVNKAGTRYVRDPVKPRPPSVKVPDVSKDLLPFLTGEAEGDFCLAVILAMRHLLRDPGRYTKVSRALDKTGQPTDPTGSVAVRWNLFGALEFFTYSFPRPERTKVIVHLKKSLPYDYRHSLMKWEEDKRTTHSAVLSLLNHAVGEYQMTRDGPTFAR